MITSQWQTTKADARRTSLAITYIQEEPRSLKQVAERLAQKTAKRLSISGLKRLAKRARLRWKRVRKSLKSLREPAAFAQSQRACKPYRNKKRLGRSICTILTKQALRWILRFRMHGKPLEK